MRLTDKLVNATHQVFSKDAGATLAFRLRYDGSMTWVVSEGLLKTEITGGSGVALSIELSAYTLGSLVAYLEAQPGYSVQSISAGMVELSAQVLLDGQGDQDASNGDSLMGYTSLMYALFDAQAPELGDARRAIIAMLQQMAVTSADDDWLDELGEYYAVKRRSGEADQRYGPRIISEVLKPKGNNIAIEEFVRSALGGTRAIVTDAPLATITMTRYRNGAHRDLAASRAHPSVGHYGQFDVWAGYDLVNDPVVGVTERVRAAAELSRDAGTRLREVAVTGEISDTAIVATDAVLNAAAVLLGADAYIPPRSLHNGTALRGGSFRYYFNGAARNGTIIRDGGVHVLGSPIQYGAELDPVATTLAPYFADTMTVPVTFAGDMRRNAGIVRSGSRNHGAELVKFGVGNSFASIAPVASDAALLTEHHTAVDTAFDPMHRYSGTLARGYVVAHRYNSSVLRDGTTTRRGVDHHNSTPIYRVTSDPVATTIAPSFADFLQTTSWFDGVYSRNGTRDRSSVQILASDSLSLVVTRSPRRNGVHKRGSQRDGSLAYLQASRMVGTIRYSGEIGVEHI